MSEYSNCKGDIRHDGRDKKCSEDLSANDKVPLLIEIAVVLSDWNPTHILNVFEVSISQDGNNGCIDESSNISNF
jgi:hypothetical protein